MSDTTTHHRVLIIGAGVCGIYQLYRLLQLQIDVAVLEAGSDLGGTWYWNRYPGARFDSESYSYSYSFSDALLQEWEWSEHFAAQPETLRYLNYVAEKFDLKQHMQFNCRVSQMRFDEEQNLWFVDLEDGRQLSCNILITAIGMLSAPTLPAIDGVETFKGESFHTYYWPKDSVQLSGKRVAVIGTGATAVQLIPVIAQEVETLTVFQRRPNWCAPLHNSQITAEEQEQIKASYDEVFAKCATTPGGFMHGPVPLNSDEVTEEERYRFWEELYRSPGFGVWLGNYRDVLIDETANQEFSEFIAGKIRERVNDPLIAEKLIPKDHGFGTRRVPMETGYYEVYNQEHVRLVDINETPIESITQSGIQTSSEHHDFDLIIYATGFDAITGSFDRLDVTGSQGRKLADKWIDGPETYLGLQTHGFPNMLTLAGPQGASVASNFPRSIEDAVNWATAFVAYLTEHGFERFEADKAAEEAWVQEVKGAYDMLLLSKTQSWFTGYNSNVPGHNTFRHLMFLGGGQAYRARIQEVADSGYSGITLS